MYRFINLFVVLIALTSHASAADPDRTAGPARHLAVDPRLQIQEPSLPLTDLMDSLFDYDLYVADPATAAGWYIEWTYGDGEVQYSFAYTSEQDAFDVMIRHLFRGTDPRNSRSLGLAYPSAKIVELPKEPDWIWFHSYDTQAEAAGAADLLEMVGLLTKVELRDTLQLLMGQQGE